MAHAFCPEQKIPTFWLYLCLGELVPRVYFFLLMNLPVIFLMAKVDIRLPLINAGMQQFPLPYLVYGGKVKTTSIYVRDFINISDYALLLFGGSLNPSNMGEGIEMVGGYLYFSAPKRIIGLIQIGHWFRLHVCRVILNF